MALNGNDFEFENLETHKNIKILLDKKLTIIYGKNGCGKTTLSRSSDFNEKLVFNSDFINKNVFIVTSEGAKDDAKTKDGFSSLWISEKIVTLKRKLLDIKVIQNNINDAYQKFITRISEKFNLFEFKLSLSDYLNLLNDKEIDAPLGDKWEEALEKYKVDFEIKTSIKDEKDLKTKIDIYNNDLLKKDFLDKVKTSNFLSSTILDGKNDEILKFESHIINYNSVITELTICEKVFNGSNAKKQREWIRMGLELHEGRNECIFCKNKNIRQSIDEWAKIIKSQSSLIKEQLNKYCENITNEFSKLLDSKDVYKKLFPKSIKFIEEAGKHVSEIKSKLEKNEPIVFDNKKFKYEKEINLNNQDELSRDISNYLFMEFLNKFTYLVLIAKTYKKAYLSKQDELDNEMNLHADTLKESINFRLKKLGFEKELSIKVDSRGDKKYAFSMSDSSIKLAMLSDGQKHKLALAIFLESISRQNLENQIVVIDDPVITLDFKTYYCVKQEIRDLMNTNVKNIILLTHNVTFLYVQLSNLFNDESVDFVKLYRLYGNKAEIVDYNLLNYDDLTLYKRGLKTVSNSYEFSLLAMLNLRIFRYFLDLRSRIEGSPDTGNPAPCIDNLSFDEQTRNKLKKHNKIFSNVIRDTNATNESLFESFKFLKEAIELLEFPQLLSKDEIIKLSSYKNDNVKTFNGETTNFIFDILSWVKEITLTNKDSYVDIKHYLDHPRQQLTKTLIGLDLSDNDGKFAL